MKGGHLEGPILEAGLGELLRWEGSRDVQVMDMCQRGKNPVTTVTSVMSYQYYAWRALENGGVKRGAAKRGSEVAVTGVGVLGCPSKMGWGITLEVKGLMTWGVRV